MAKFTNVDFKISMDLRPCSVEVADKALINGLFHKWVDKCEIIPPSIMVGGHSGGELKYCVGLVELEDGKVIAVLPSAITFTDKEMID